MQNSIELNNFHPATNLPKLYGKSEFADVYFNFADEHKQIPAHKCLLAVASPVFQKMFFGELRELGNIDIVDASHDGFMEFLRFFYFDKYKLTVDHIGEVLTMADKYDVHGLVNLCEQFLDFNLNIESVCWIYELALLFNRTYLMQLCKNRITSETRAIMATEGFKNCTKLVLTKFLEMNELGCDEIQVYKGAMDWAEESCRKENLEVTMANKKQQLGPCFDLIRFPTMSTEQFSQCIAEEGVLDATDFLQIFSYLTLKRNIKSSRFSTEPRNGRPIWTKDNLVIGCDRRSLPNLNRMVTERRDLTVILVSERILLGQLMFSTLKSRNDEEANGILTIRRRFVSDNPSEILLQQNVKVSVNGYTKTLLDGPVILEPFIEYELETNWTLEEEDQLLFRTYCRDEIMTDGGVVLKFLRDDSMPYDNVTEGLIAKLYFKKW